jgi:cob(I)alamin adenosyltransferase
MIYVFTGNGKGKTSAALGAGLRMVGSGKKVLLIQFLKTNISSENKALDKIDNFDVKSFGREGFFLPKEEIDKYPELKEKGVKPFENKDFELAQKALSFAERQSSNYDLLILDEINVAIHFNLINKSETLAFLDKIKEACHIILTGRQCPQKIIEKADLVTDFQEIKHYYQKNVKAIKGIDF